MSSQGCVLMVCSGRGVSSGRDSELWPAVGSRPLSVALGQKAHCLRGKWSGSLLSAARVNRLPWTWNLLLNLYWRSCGTGLSIADYCQRSNCFPNQIQQGFHTIKICPENLTGTSRYWVRYSLNFCHATLWLAINTRSLLLPCWHWWWLSWGMAAGGLISSFVLATLTSRDCRRDG